MITNKILSNLSLLNIPKFKDIVEITNAFNITIDQDLLFKEYISVKKFIADITDSERQLPCDERWVCFFKQNSSPQFLKIIEYIFSIPHANATCERIFSLMTSAWRKDRNRLMLENLEAELMIKQNFSMNCSEFQNFVKNEGVVILNEVKSSNKY